MAQKNSLFICQPFDYILFGVRLFVRGKMAYKALESLLKIMLQKQEDYSKLIHERCKKHNIDVCITSPFQQPV